MFLLVPAPAVMGQDVNWKTTVGEAVDTLQQYLRFNNTNLPGDVTEAAGFLQNILQREGLTVTRYEASPGKVNLAARLKGSGDAKPTLLLHHMDVVPADWREAKGHAGKWDDHRTTSEWYPTPIWNRAGSV